MNLRIQQLIENLFPCETQRTQIKDMLNASMIFRMKLPPEYRQFELIEYILIKIKEADYIATHGNKNHDFVSLAAAILTMEYFKVREK